MECLLRLFDNIAPAAPSPITPAPNAAYPLADDEVGLVVFAFLEEVLPAVAAGPLGGVVDVVRAFGRLGPLGAVVGVTVGVGLGVGIAVTGISPVSLSSPVSKFSWRITCTPSSCSQGGFTSSVISFAGLSTPEPTIASSSGEYEPTETLLPTKVGFCGAGRPVSCIGTGLKCLSLKRPFLTRAFDGISSPNTVLPNGTSTSAVCLTAGGACLPILHSPGTGRDPTERGGPEGPVGVSQPGVCPTRGACSHGCVILGNTTSPGSSSP